MKRTILILLVLALCLPAAAPAEESPGTARLRGAEEVRWAGGDLVCVDGDLIRMTDGETLLTGVHILDGWTDAETGERVLFAGGTGFAYRIDPDGNAAPLAGWTADLYDDVIWTESGFAAFPLRTAEPDGVLRAAVFDFARDRFVGQIIDSDYWETWTDPETGLRYVLEINDGWLCEDGRVIASGYYLAPNADFRYVTDGLVTGYDKSRDPWQPVVLSLETGAVLARFDGSWLPYDAQNQIFADHLAILTDAGSFQATRVVGLDGSVLLDVGPDGWLSDYMAWDWGWRFMRDGREWVFDVYTGRLWEVLTDEETWEQRYADPSDGEVFGAESLEALMAKYPRDPALTEKYPPIAFAETVSYDPETDGFVIRRADGAVIGDRSWYGIRNYNTEGIGSESAFAPWGWTVVQTDERHTGVLRPDGTMPVPAAYTEVIAAPGAGFIVRDDAGWHITDENGTTLY